MAQLLYCATLLLAATLAVTLAAAQPPPATPPATPAAVAALLAQARARLDPPQPVALALARRAEAAARALPNDTLRGLALDVQGDYHWQRTEPALALPLLLAAGPLLAAAGPGSRARHQYHLAATHTDLRQRRPALAAYRRAFLLAGQAADSAVQRAEIVNSLGVFYLTFDRPDSAAYYLFRALRRQQALHRPEAEASTLTNLGAVFYQRQQYAVAAGYARQALALQRQLADTLGQANAFNTLAVIAARLPSPDSLRAALRYYRAAAQALAALHLSADAAQADHAQGTVYQRLGRPDSAEVRFRSALRLYAAAHDSASATYPALALADLLVGQRRRLPEAAALAEAVRRLAHRSGRPEDERTALNLLANLATLRRDYRAANALLRQERTLADSLTAHDNRRLTAELRAQYETEQAQQRVRVLETARELSGLRQQRTVAGLLAALLLAVGAAAVGVGRYRRRQRRRETALRQRLAADLHDDVGSLLTLVALETALLRPAPAVAATLAVAASPAGTTAEVTAETTAEIAAETTAQATAAATQLARHARIAEAAQRAVRQLRDVVWSVDTRHDSFADLLDRLRDHAHEVLATADIELDFDFDPSGLPPEPLALEARHALYLIYKEALHNVVKHARATVVTVRLARAARHLQLTIADDGPGLPPGPVASGGHGLANMRQRATVLGGEVLYENDGGLLVRVRLPLG